jgi:MFS transporter, Spinster family, sphingosine-1-phosphate transporter
MTNSSASVQESAVQQSSHGRPMPADSDLRPRIFLTLLTAAVVISYLDRFVLAMLIQPIKRELVFSDTQIGWLVGFAFSAVYAVFGVPVAHLADKGYRRNVIVTSLFVWSAMTAICGSAQNFWQLLAARFGVGAGEAGTLPASQSIISDLFPYEQRSTALAILGAGGGLGIMLAFAIGGLLEQRWGWRLTMVLVAIPGIPLAGLIGFFLKEPPMGRYAARLESAHSGGSRGSFRELLANRAFRHLPFGQAGVAFLLFGQTQWLPAFIERSFSVPRVHNGIALALTQGVTSLLGGILGGLIADRLAKRNPLWPLRFAMMAIVGGFVPMFWLYFTFSVSMIYPLAAIMTFLFSMPTGPLFSLLQAVVNPARRATAASLSAMAAAFIGLGCGPLLIGILSDHFSSGYGKESLRAAMLVTGIIAGPWTLFHLGRLNSVLTPWAIESR